MLQNMLYNNNYFSISGFGTGRALKGVVASYQAALSKEYTPLKRVKPVLTWSRGYPGHNKMVSEGQIQ